MNKSTNTTQKDESNRIANFTTKRLEDKPVEPVRGADIIRESITRQAVQKIFAYPGAATVEIHHSFLRSAEVEILLARHEQGAAFAAQGYARSSGKVGVCMATSGPGATNLLTGIQGAAMDSVPLVALTGQVATDAIGTDAFQETDVLNATNQMTKRSFQIRSTEEIPRILNAAFELARSGRPGPVLVDIPKDVQKGYARPDFTETLELNPTPARSNPEPDPAAINQAISWLNSADKPVTCAGGGVISAAASRDLIDLATRARIPVATTLKGLGSFPENHELSLGLLGMHGTEYANLAVANADLLLAVGTRFSDRVTGDVDRFAPHAKIIHIDIDPAEINKNKPADLGIESDARLALEQLKEKLNRGGNYGPWLNKLVEWKQNRPLRYRDREDAILPQEVCEQLSRLTDGQTILASGVGQHQMFAAQFYQFRRPRTWLSSSGLGAMGFGYPAALGAQAANPKQQVVVVDGDGSFLMNVQELATAAQHDLPVKAIINNRHLGMVAQFEDKFYAGDRADTDLSDPEVDFVGICEAYGIPAGKIGRARELKPALEELLDHDGPRVLEVEVPYQDDVLPMIPAGGSIEDMIVPEV